MRIQYTLKVYPAGLGRSVYRTITICGTDTLDQLCMAILNAFDFTAEHLYEFCMDNKMYSEDCYRFNPMEDDLFDEDDAEGTDIALDELGLIEGRKFSLLGIAAGTIGYQKAKAKSDLVYLEKSKAFVYGYEVGIRPEMLLSPKVALFAEYRFEMLFNSILRNNNHVGLGCVIYL